MEHADFEAGHRSDYLTIQTCMVDVTIIQILSRVKGTEAVRGWFECQSWLPMKVNTGLNLTHTYYSLCYHYFCKMFC